MRWLWRATPLLLGVLALASCGRDQPTGPRLYHVTGHVVLTGYLVDSTGLFAGTKVVGDADGVLVELLSGRQVFARTTTVDGIYQFAGIPSGSYTARSTVIGDIGDETELLTVASSNLAVADTLKLTARGDLLPVPNPIGSRTVIYFELPASEPIEVRILDTGDNVVRRLFDGTFPGGLNAVGWDVVDENDTPATGALYWVTLFGPDGVRAQLLFR